MIPHSNYSQLTCLGIQQAEFTEGWLHFQSLTKCYDLLLHLELIQAKQTVSVLKQYLPIVPVTNSSLINEGNLDQTRQIVSLFWLPCLNFTIHTSCMLPYWLFQCTPLKVLSHKFLDSTLTIQHLDHPGLLFYKGC